jgi:DAK2 domain fusion protein YloV
MVLEVRRKVCDGRLLKWLLAAGVSWLAHHRKIVNDMNVFPVPDGDTGTNMLVTIQKAYNQIADLDEPHIGIVAEAVARGGLMGARGNSGTILSMLLRGFASSLKRREMMDAAGFAEAVQGAVEYAYETVGTVMKPVEGTILTVARDAAAAVQESARAESDLRILLEDMVRAAKASLQRTPELLPRLKEAGVVDSGGMGLVYILEGMLRLLEGETVADDGDAEHVGASAPASWQEAIKPDDEEGYGYDVQFLMHGTNMDVAEIRQAISAMGWSPLIDGDSSLIKVHIHVFNPGEPLSYAATQPDVQLDDVVVENMQAQYLQYVQSREQREAPAQKQVDGVAVIAVARGAGIERVFEEYGAARIVEGGQTMNPGTEDFLAAIDSLHTNEIVILPNNGNVILAAEEASKLAHGKTVRVIHNKTIPQGIAAMLAYGDLRERGAKLNDIAAAMTDSLSSVISCEITTATRTVTMDGVAVTEGELIGLLNGKLAASGGTMREVLLALLHKCHAEDHELATLYYGEGVTEAQAQALANEAAAEFDHLEFQVIAGQQPLYPYLISIE